MSDWFGHLVVGAMWSVVVVIMAVVLFVMVPLLTPASWWAA